MGDTRKKVTVVKREHEGRQVWMLRAESGKYLGRVHSKWFGFVGLYEPNDPKNAALYYGESEAEAHITAWQKGYRLVSETEN